MRPPPAVCELLAALPRPDAPGVRWVPPDQWHITLRFLGEASEDEVIRAVRQLSSPPAHVTLGPSVRRLRRSVACLPADGLAELAGSLAVLTAELGEPVRLGPFRGHLTLARLRAGARCSLVGAPFSTGFVVDTVSLVRSTLDHEGARHETIATQPLT